MKGKILFLVSLIFLSGCNDQDRINTVEKSTVEDVKENSNAIATKEEALSFCKSIESLAESIMTQRQNEVLMSDLLKSFNNDENKDIYSIAEDFAIEAYDLSAYSTAKFKENAIKQFKNKKFHECYSEIIIKN